MYSQKYSFIMSVIACTTLLCACATDDADSTDNSNTSTAYTSAPAEGRPMWQVDMYSNEAQPNWADPDMTQFENSMFVLVKLQDELVPFSTDDDRMASFIDGQCRSVVAQRSVHDTDGSVYFALKILGNAIDRDVSMEARYYSGGLHQHFALRGVVDFIAELTYGVDFDYIPDFLQGCTKYPVKMSILVNPENLPAEPSDGDLIGAFIGGECRGVCTTNKPLTVYGYQNGEQVELRYYSDSTKTIYTLKEKIALNGEVSVDKISF